MYSKSTPANSAADRRAPDGRNSAGPGAWTYKDNFLVFVLLHEAGHLRSNWVVSA